MDDVISITVGVNGRSYERAVEPRLLLSDFLRHELGLTGTHVGCEHGVCGACTVLLDGEAVRSCLLFAVQCDGHALVTVEGLAESPERLHPIQRGFWEAHGLQCGFCTPGILMTLIPFLAQNPRPEEKDIREAISGNLCRCTGYQHIVTAVKLAAGYLAEADGAGGTGEALSPAAVPEEMTE
jgi:carbon-monoxide dehydrogenase small subunit